MTRWSLFLQTLSLLHHFLGLYSTDLPGSFVAVEATFGLTVLDGEDQPLTALELGEVVQGEGTHARFFVRNDGNTRARIGFRIRAGDGEENVFEPAARLDASGRDKASQTRPGLGEDAAQELRKVHQGFHEKIGELDTPEKQDEHKQFHEALNDKAQHLLKESGNARARTTEIKPEPPASDVALKLREWHEDFHEKIGELDTPE